MTCILFVMMDSQLQVKVQLQVQCAMKNFAKICNKSIINYAKICKSMQVFYKVCKIIEKLTKYARVWKLKDIHISFFFKDVLSILKSVKINLYVSF